MAMLLSFRCVIHLCVRFIIEQSLQECDATTDAISTTARLIKKLLYHFLDIIQLH